MLTSESRQKAAYPLEYEEYLMKYAAEYHLEPATVAGVIHTESRFKADAQSSAGARGLMQIMPSTGKWIAKRMGLSGFDADQLYDPETNIKMGCWYLDYLYDRFHGVDDVVFAAYNTGPTRIDSWLGNEEYSSDGLHLNVVPNHVTEDYINKVNRARKRYEEYYGL
ncbi:MAG: lytic transglycosylase domain-containing protein [Clostridiales bacterium]|nr:lytic transglycosylase domain-containing protein [Clostridiales bacterium]